MTYQEFCGRISASLEVGMEFCNPGGGTSVVVRIDADRIVYQRRNTRIAISFGVMFKAYEHFSGSFVLTRDLKRFDNSFDSSARDPAGHNCNCTFMFLVFKQAGLGGDIVPGKCFGQGFLKVD